MTNMEAVSQLFVGVGFLWFGAGVLIAGISFAYDTYRAWRDSE